MFRPKIIGFVCNWSLPTEVEIAGSRSIRGYPKIHIVRVRCVGGIDPVIMLETFVQGADGILVISCPPHDCHHIEGNSQAEQKIEMLRKLLSLTGLEPERLQLEWTYPTEIGSFVRIIDKFRDQIVKLGQTPLTGENPNETALLNVLAAENAAADFRLRVLIGRKRELTEATNVYGEKISQEEFDELLDEIVKEEFIRHKIRLLVKQKPRSVKELAAIMHVKPASVLNQIVDMRRKGMMTLDHVEETTPLYKALEVE